MLPASNVTLSAILWHGCKLEVAVERRQLEKCLKPYFNEQPIIYRCSPCIGLVWRWHWIIIIIIVRSLSSKSIHSVSVSIKCPKPTLRSPEAFLSPTCLSRAAGIFTPNLWQLTTGTTGVTGTPSAGRIPPLSRSLAHHIMLDMVGTLMPNLLATRDWAIAASSSENRCAISTSVFARLIALLKRSMALLRLPLQQVTCHDISLYQYAPLNNKGLFSYRANLLRQQILFIKHNTNITCTHREILTTYTKENAHQNMHFKWDLN